MPEVPAGLHDAVARFDASSVADIVVVTASIYWLLLLVRGTTAMTVLRGVGVLLLSAFVLSRIFDLTVLNWALRNSVAGLLVGMVVVFQPEIRRALERLGRTGLRTAMRRAERAGAINTVVITATGFARQSLGALIVFERETGLQEVIDTGVLVGATLSVELLSSIFPEQSPLHDGAVVVRGDVIIAAGCTLPLSEAPLPGEFGMRHRAAVGLTERTDAVVVVVSEERGEIAVASSGRMVTGLDEVQLARQLHRLFDLEPDVLAEAGQAAAIVTTGGIDRREVLVVAGTVWRRLRAQMRNTPGLAVLSFLLAVSLWYFVTDTENPTLIDVYPSPISVEPVNVTEALAVANQLPAVQIRISAPSDRWERLTPANFKAVVDLNGFGARSQEVPVRVEVDGVRGVRVIDVQPRTIVVNLEDLTTRQVSVAARAVGSAPLGYQIGAVTPQTTSARVSGPESLVALIDQAVADVNVTGLTVNVQQNVVLKAVGTGGAEIRGVRLEPTNVPVNVEVIQTAIVRTVPLAVDVAGEPDPGYAVSRVASSPSTIQVQGSIEVLQQIDRIRLSAVSVAGARSDIVRSVQIPLPAGLSYVDRDRATVTVTITPAAGSRRTTLAVEVLNVAAGRVGRVQGTGSVDVILDGPLPVLNAMAASELRATVDAGWASTGTLTLTVNVKTPDGVTVKSVQPASVAVTIGGP